LRSHQTMGDLWMDFDWKSVTEYKRSLNLGNATSLTEFKSEGHTVTQEVFVSAPDQAVLIRLHTTHPEGFRGMIRMDRPMDQNHPTTETKALHDNLLEMKGMVTQRDGQIDSKPDPILHGVKFRVLLLAQHQDGEIKASGESLQVAGSKEIFLKLVAETSYYKADFEKKAEAKLDRIAFSSWGQLLQTHEREYKSWYDRMSLTLGSGAIDELPTDQRIQSAKAGQTDLHLEKLLFDFGRYLLISSSRPGTNPANLQGLWNQHISAPWNA